MQSVLSNKNARSIERLSIGLTRRAQLSLSAAARAHAADTRRHQLAVEAAAHAKARAKAREDKKREARLALMCKGLDVLLAFAQSETMHGFFKASQNFTFFEAGYRINNEEIGKEDDLFEFSIDLKPDQILVSAGNGFRGGLTYIHFKPVKSDEPEGSYLVTSLNYDGYSGGEFATYREYLFYNLSFGRSRPLALSPDRKNKPFDMQLVLSQVLSDCAKPRKFGAYLDRALKIEHEQLKK